MAIAFYAPLKSPDDPVPSGDRAFARLLWAALDRAGLAPELASRLRLFHRGDAALPPLEAAAAAEVERLTRLYAARPPAARPRLWFTYHVYYKAPDLIGPAVAAALDLPYVIAEGSRAPKRASGATARGHALAEAALDHADLILIPNPADRLMLEAARPPGQQLALLPPFIDPNGWPPPGDRLPAPHPRLLTVAMMRPGDKLASYRLLAEALHRTALPDWTLDIVGDGPARATVEALFAPFGRRIRWHGLVTEPAALGACYAAADLLVWPAVNEAFGMVFLEAALHGCPALAGAYGGVGAVIRDRETGWLTAPGDVAALAEALPLACQAAPRLGQAARRHVRESASLAPAADRLYQLLTPLLACAEDPPHA